MLVLIVRLAPRILLFTPVAVGLSFLAETDGTNTAIDALFKGGPFAFVLGLVLLEKLVTPGERDLLRKQLLESQTRERALYDKVNSEVLPAVIENSRINKESIRPLLERIVHLLDDSSRKM